MKDETEGDGQFAAPLAELVREYPATLEMGETDQKRSTENFPDVKQLVKQIELRLNNHRSVAMTSSLGGADILYFNFVV